MTINLTTVPAGRQVGGHRGDGRRIVAALAITTTIGYGSLYCAYAVLLRPIAATLGVSATVVTGALTASVLASALMAIPVGRWLDHHGGRALMIAGSIAATVVLPRGWGRGWRVGRRGRCGGGGDCSCAARLVGQLGGRPRWGKAGHMDLPLGLPPVNQGR
nr:hypothetical protein [Micromonospora sp. 15K316]